MRIRKLIINNKKRQIVNKNELQQIFLKFFFVWLMLKKNIFLDLGTSINRLLFVNAKGKAYFSSVKNICLLSGRTKSVVRLYKISRIKFNEYMIFGRLPG
jgi:ribosomal protein S14